jgi:hypothetical protein
MPRQWIINWKECGKSGQGLILRYLEGLKKNMETTVRIVGAMAKT